MIFLVSVGDAVDRGYVNWWNRDLQTYVAIVGERFSEHHRKLSHLRSDPVPFHVHLPGKVNEFLDYLDSVRKKREHFVQEVD